MMMTGSQYEESLRKLDLTVYLFGERVRNVVDHVMPRMCEFQTAVFVK
ncbi:MAG: hypothetical protein JW950_11955 [Deltaproteobacteria bacterium]|nr:hypothetical protein [Deltaproteobacteria bacterium]